MKPKGNRFGIKWNLFLSFWLFSIALLILLWLFQTVFLDDFYKAIKSNMIESSAKTIAANIENEDLAALLDRLAQNNDVSILILAEDGTRLYEAANIRESLITVLPPARFMAYFQKASQTEDGAVLDLIDLSNFRNDYYRPDRFTGPVPGIDRRQIESLVYGQIITLSDGSRQFVLLNTILTPVYNTVATLRVQLVIVTSILLILSFCLALVLSRRIARPIVAVNEQSKELAKGHYSVSFTASG